MKIKSILGSCLLVFCLAGCYGKVPKIIKQPVDTTVIHGQKAVLSVMAYGYPPLLYYWYHDGRCFYSGDKAKVEYPSAQYNDAGKYFCVVHDDNGSNIKSDEVELVVDETEAEKVPPKFLSCYGADAVDEDERAQFYAGAYGGAQDETYLSGAYEAKRPISYQWYKDDSPISGETKRSLNIAKASAVDEGAYVCEASNFFGATRSETMNLHVRLRPRITSGLAPIQVNEGETITLKVEATGEPPLNYYWSNNAYVSGAADLTIENFQFSEAGKYSCSVRNKLGSVSTDALVSFRAKPVRTNLKAYPLAVFFQYSITKVKLNGTDAGQTDYGLGWRQDVELSMGANNYMITGYDEKGEMVKSPYDVTITYDPKFSTEKKELLYLRKDHENNTFVIDLTDGYVLGLLPDVRMAAVTPDGSLVVDDVGNVYRTSDQAISGGALPVESWPGRVPVFSADGRYAYWGNGKIDMASRQLMSDSFPLDVTAPNARLLPDNTLAMAQSVTEVMIVDLATDKIVSPSAAKLGYTYAGVILDPTLSYSFKTSYDWGNGSLSVYDIGTGERIYSVGMGDFAFMTVFSNDGKYAYTGAAGNPYWGGGEICVSDIEAGQVVSRYPIFGASTLAVGADDLIYAHSTGMCGNYSQGWPGDNRGIEVLRHNEAGQLERVRTYYLGQLPGESFMKKPFFIKPGA